MSIVTPHQGDGSTESAQLDVVVLHQRDAQAASAGGADRLLLSADPEDGHYSPEPSVVSAVVRESDVPVWVVLRTREEASYGGHAGLVSLGSAFIELGARGVAYGFLDRDLEIDRRACAEMCAELGGVPWMFHGFDTALDVQHAWRDVIGLPGLESVITAGLDARADPRRRRPDHAGQARPAGRGAGDGRRWPDPGRGAVAGPGRRTPVRDRVLGPRGRLLDARLGGRRPGPVVADARRRRALASPRPAGRLTGRRRRLSAPLPRLVWDPPLSVLSMCAARWCGQPRAARRALRRAARWRCR